MERYEIKFYILVINSIIYKCGQFHYVICRIDKITLLLVIWHPCTCDVIKNCLNY